MRRIIQDDIWSKGGTENIFHLMSGWRASTEIVPDSQATDIKSERTVTKPYLAARFQRATTDLEQILTML